jgi:hypothetical protein
MTRLHGCVINRVGFVPFKHHWLVSDQIVLQLLYSNSMQNCMKALIRSGCVWCATFEETNRSMQ